MTAEVLPIRAALNRAQRRALDRVDPERAEVLLALVDRHLGDLRDLPTLTVAQVARVLGISQGAAYDAVRSGAIPALAFGRRRVVPTVALAALLLGVEPSP